MSCAAEAGSAAGVSVAAAAAAPVGTASSVSERTTNPAAVRELIGIPQHL